MYLSKVPYKRIFAEKVNTIKPCPPCPPPMLPIILDEFTYNNAGVIVSVPLKDGFLGPVFKPFVVNIPAKSQIVLFCETNNSETVDFASVRNNFTYGVNYNIPWDNTMYLIIPTVNPATPFSSKGIVCFSLAD